MQHSSLGTERAPTLTAMPRPCKPASPFGVRLVALRKARNLTQTDLAKMLGTSQRAISYYEAKAGNPPLETIAKMAQILGTTPDELLGFSDSTGPKTVATEDPTELRLWRKFKQVRKLREKDQRAVFRLVTSLAGSQGDESDSE